MVSDDRIYWQLSCKYNKPYVNNDNACELHKVVKRKATRKSKKGCKAEFTLFWYTAPVRPGLDNEAKRDHNRSVAGKNKSG